MNENAIDFLTQAAPHILGFVCPILLGGAWGMLLRVNGDRLRLRDLNKRFFLFMIPNCIAGYLVYKALSYLNHVDWFEANGVSFFTYLGNDSIETLVIMLIIIALFFMSMGIASNVN